MSKMQKIAIIGATGWIGTEVTRAILENGINENHKLICSNRSGPSSVFEDLEDIFWASSAEQAAQEANLIILSVRPEQFRQLSLDLNNKLVLSFMAGITMNELKYKTRAERVVRAMPNAALSIRRSYTPWVASTAVMETDSQLIDKILGALGEQDALENEDQFDFLTALSGAGPAYVALLTSAMQRAAERYGIAQEIAVRASHKTNIFGALLMNEERLTADELVKRYVGYDGVVAEALHSAIGQKFSETVEQALLAGCARAKNLT